MAAMDEVIHEISSAVKENLASFTADGTIFEMEIMVRRHDGNYRWHLKPAVPIKAGNI